MREFVYNDANRMSQVKQGGVAVMNYAYNGRGEQVRKHVGTTNTYTVYDETGHWLGDYDGTGAPLQQALWMDDLPVGLLANGNQLHYVEPDHLGSPRVVIDVARNVPVWTWDLKGEAFGSTAPDQDADGDSIPFVLDMRFPGQRFDAGAAIESNGHRRYDHDSGRYMSSDPIGLMGGVNTFAYANSSPLIFNDVGGLQVGAIPASTVPGSSVATIAASDSSINQNNNSSVAALADFGPRINAQDVGNFIGLTLNIMGSMSIANPNNALTKVVSESTCGDPGGDECRQLGVQVQRAKIATSSLGKCKAGMSVWELSIRENAWLDEAVARARHDTKCWAGGDSGHQTAQAQAWRNLSNCQSLLSSR